MFISTHPAVRRVATGVAISMVLTVGGTTAATAAGEQQVEPVTAVEQHVSQGRAKGHLPKAEVPSDEVVRQMYETMDAEQRALVAELDGLIADMRSPHGAAGDAEASLIPAAYGAAVAACAVGALSSVPLTALSDIKNGRPSPWHDYVFNAIASCALPIVGRWVWKLAGPWVKQQFVSLVLSIVLRWF